MLFAVSNMEGILGLILFGVGVVVVFHIIAEILDLFR